MNWFYALGSVAAIVAAVVAVAIWRKLISQDPDVNAVLRINAAASRLGAVADKLGQATATVQQIEPTPTEGESNAPSP